MNTQTHSLNTQDYSLPGSYWIITFALASGFLLSIFSWLELCLEHCSATQAYYIFGMPFSFFGLAFFTIILTLHLFSRKYPFLSKIVGLMIAAAFGSEIIKPTIFEEGILSGKKM